MNTHTRMPLQVQLFYQDAKGAHIMRAYPSAADAAPLLKRLRCPATLRLIADSREVGGVFHDEAQVGKNKWAWWYEGDGK
jgi:hypothetical protein